MSEEVKNASKTIPRTMLTVYVLNFILLFPALVTICYHIPSLDDALNDPTTYPAIYVMRQSMSTAWITVILSIITLITIASSINYYAAVTRDLFAFVSNHESSSVNLIRANVCLNRPATTACPSPLGSAPCTPPATSPSTPPKSRS
jgi:hypothetical protein